MQQSRLHTTPATVLLDYFDTRSNAAPPSGDYQFPARYLRHHYQLQETRQRALRKTQLLIGIPGDAVHTSPDGKRTVSTAVIGYTMEMGDPERNIPARPFLAPGVESIEAKIVMRLQGAATSAFSGDTSAVDKAFHAIGLEAVNAIKATIVDGPFTPLADSTLKARARRKTPSGEASRYRRTKDAKQELANRAAGMAASSDIAKPLLDTSEMMKAVAYVIRAR